MGATSDIFIYLHPIKNTKSKGRVYVSSVFVILFKPTTKRIAQILGSLIKSGFGPIAQLVRVADS